MADKLMSMSKPRILVFAGPNGSGKSTLTDAYKIEGIYINADEIKKVRRCSDLEAATEAELLREDSVSAGRSFTFETVLSTRRNLDFLIRAKDAGYHISSVFVLTTSPEINVLRVRSRVCDGGHDVPADKIRSRYKKAFDNISELAALSDECRIFDNSGIPQIIFLKIGSESHCYENNYWTQEQITKLVKAPKE